MFCNKESMLVQYHSPNSDFTTYSVHDLGKLPDETESWLFYEMPISEESKNRVF